MHSGVIKPSAGVQRHAAVLQVRQTPVCGLPPRHTRVFAWREQHDKQDLYEHALELSRLEQYDEAREAFQRLLSQDPSFCRGWVSYAQMERRAARIQDPQRLVVAREILQRGLQINPDSGCLAQAWGLMELQKGNAWAAVRLLERSVAMDPFLEPVLKWKPVNAARMTVASASRNSCRNGRLSNHPAARVVCASAGGSAAAAAGSGAASAGAAGACSTGSTGALCSSSHEVQGTSQLGNSSCMSSM